MKLIIMGLGVFAMSMLSLAEGVTLYVSPKGQDIWSGTLVTPNKEKTDGPLATLTGARDTLRRLRNSGKLPNGATIQLQNGRYEQLTPVIFKDEDSGTAAAPIIFTATPQGTVRITGGVMLWQMKTLTSSNVLQRLPEVARGKVQVISLPAQGLYDYGIEPVGASATPASGIQL
ncbi:MAG: hypothetical protein WCJ02_13910, partial [bacterium]